MARRSRKRERKSGEEDNRREGEEGMGASSLIIIVFPGESISTLNHFQFVV